MKSIHPQNYPVLIEHPDYAGASKGREYPIPTDTLLLEGTFTLGANTEFALTHNLDLEPLYLAGYTRLFNTIQYKVTGNTLSDVFLVATIEDANGETLKYQRWNLYNPQDEWFVYHFRKFEFNWEYDDLKSPKRLKIYLWNPNKQQITVRNLRVSDR
ncbi:MAG TPA: hypothetical protein VFV37_10140 [Luteibaculaceae bacterium]|nr:hypothetical protein [Luteibaculaceae bacterium]